VAAWSEVRSDIRRAVRPKAACRAGACRWCLDTQPGGHHSGLPPRPPLRLPSHARPRCWQTYPMPLSVSELLLQGRRRRSLTHCTAPSTGGVVAARICAISANVASVLFCGWRLWCDPPGLREGWSQLSVESRLEIYCEARRLALSASHASEHCPQCTALRVASKFSLRIQWFAARRCKPVSLASLV
jgi:hypothetical protein